jgi:uncharacterized protein YbcV (DUF1398 family)
MPALTYEKFQQIQESSAGRPYPEYVKNLKEAGVTRYEVNVANQLTVVYADEGDPLEVPVDLPQLVCANTFEAGSLKAAQLSTQSGLIGYPEFLSEIAEAGVHRYVADLEGMKITYYGKDEANKLEESIPTV